MLYGTEGGGRGQKSKYTFLPRAGRVDCKLYSATRQDYFKSQNVRGRPAGGPYILIFSQVPLPQFHMDCVHR